MITANSRRGLLGLGDLGLVMPTQHLGATEDTLILGVGRKLQKHSVLLGALITNRIPASPLPTSTAPMQTQTKYITPDYSPMPTVPAPVLDTSVPEPGAGMLAPRLVSPSGASGTWTQTPESPTPMRPPVQRLTTPPPPLVDESPMSYGTETPANAATGNDWSYYGSDPYEGRPTADAAGIQTNEQRTNELMALATNTQTGETQVITPDSVVKTNADGTQTTQKGDIIDPTTGTKVGTDWIQWAKDNKATLGIGAAVVVGAIVLLKVLR